MSDLFGCGYTVSHFGDPFLVMVMWLCGYAVSHSEPSALIPLLDLYFICHMVIVIVIERL